MKATSEIDGWFSYQKTYNFLLGEMPADGFFVELGAWLGKSSSYLCDTATTQKIFIVDSWKGSINELETTHRLAVEQDIYPMFLENMGNRKFTPLRMTSVEAAKMFEDESLDVVFIDLDHSYESVVEDIATWYPKVKHGGYIAGHDYTQGWPGVVQAVNEAFADILLIDDCWLHLKW